MNLTNELKSHFLNLYHLTLTDSEVDELELEMLYRIGEERGISLTQIQDVVLRPDKIRFSFPETVIEKVECLYDFARIAWADGKIDSSEEKLLEMFCSKFGFEEENIPTLSRFLLDEAEKGTSTEQLLKIVSENI
ncbi:MAG: Tellurite resistance protein TerB [Acidobacteria bacterium]|jgi:uncharacterized tellurite resistance protein B-like protein|nr:Tellurite resistance protein TerB [Acidobacteriota bacterium]